MVLKRKVFIIIFKFFFKMGDTFQKLFAHIFGKFQPVPDKFF